eukprot:Tamp_35958.p2 GENE.Tamp_35958~~Tamp_35958.p2  ORF type:complete len:153 (+),score=13.34 Tamp_35958:80-538(+)
MTRPPPAAEKQLTQDGTRAASTRGLAEGWKGSLCVWSSAAIDRGNRTCTGCKCGKVVGSLLGPTAARKIVCMLAGGRVLVEAVRWRRKAMERRTCPQAPGFSTARVSLLDPQPSVTPSRVALVLALAILAVPSHSSVFIAVSCNGSLTLIAW